MLNFKFISRKIMKEKLLAHLNQLIDDRIAVLQLSIEAAKQSRDNETKSTAGDKYETGRSMAQMELHKLNEQLQQALKQKEAISKIPIDRQHNTIEFGSLVSASSGTYFISVGLGKIEFESHPVFCVSLASPIGRQLEGGKPGDSIKINSSFIEILGIK